MQASVVHSKTNGTTTLALLLARHDTAICATVAEAFETCMREPFDFVLCDLMMPNGGEWSL